MKRFLQKLFKLRKDVGLNFYLADFLFRKLLRQNPGTTWAVHYSSTLYSPEKIVRGKNVFPGDSPGNFIEAGNGIIIGDYTNIGPNVGIISANHDLIDNSKMTASPPIKIGKCCWIGMNATLLPGVEIGDFTIVGAGSVVTKSFISGFQLIAGNPAQVVKQLDKNECLQFIFMKNDS